MAEPPSTGDLEKLLPGGFAQAAVSAARGYDWQRWLTVEAWLALEREDALWIEWGEDFTVAGTNGVMTIQAKDLSRPISLTQKRIIKIIEAAISRGDNVTTHIWTRAIAGVEKGNRTGRSGIDLWRSASPDAMRELRRIFARAPHLGAATRRLFRDSTDDQLFIILHSVRWVTGEGPIEELMARCERAVEERLRVLELMSPSVRRRPIAALLFALVAFVGTRESIADRRLTRRDLDQFLTAQNALDFAAALPAVQTAIAARKTLPLLTEGPSSAPIQPFTPQWFVYTERVTQFLGRDAELTRLNEFAAGNMPFSWWLITGPGGVGKSRLAAEAVELLGGNWEAGFIPVSRLAGLHNEFAHGLKDCFVVIDDVGIDLQAVRDLLRVAMSHGGSNAKIRILLIEREAHVASQVMAELLADLSPGTAELIHTLFGDPLELAPPLKVDREIIRSWLAAAGLDPSTSLSRLKPKDWERIKTLTAGIPLLLGFAAAAIADGRTDFSSGDALLHPHLRRELKRWEVVAPDPLERERLLTLATVGVLAGGLPIPSSDDHRLALIRIGGPADGEMIVMQAPDGPWRLPTIAEVMTRPDLVEHKLAFEAIGAKTLSTLERLVPSTALPQALDKLEQLIGAGWRLQPDLLAGYFLSRRWAERKTSYRRNEVLQPVSDEQLSSELLAAWRVDKMAVLYNLQMLRDTDPAGSPYLRALSALAKHVASERKASKRILKFLGAQAHDALVRFNREQSQGPLKDVVINALRTLSKAFDHNNLLRFRLFSVLILAAKRSNSDEPSPHSREAAELLPQVIEQIKRNRHLKVEFHALDVFRKEIAEALSRRDDDVLRWAFGALDLLVFHWGHVAEIRNTVSKIHVSVSYDLGMPGEAAHCIPVEAFESDTGSCVSALEASISNLIAACWEKLSAERKYWTRTSLVNLSHIYLKMGRYVHVERVYKWLITLPAGDERSGVEGELQCNAIVNVLDAKLAERAIEEALHYVETALCIGQRNTTPEVRAGALAMARDFILTCLEEGRISLALVVAKRTIELPWTTTSPLFVEVLVQKFTTIQQAFQQALHEYDEGPTAITSLRSLLLADHQKHTIGYWASLINAGSLTYEDVGGGITQFRADEFLLRLTEAVLVFGRKHRLVEALCAAVFAYEGRFGRAVPPRVASTLPFRFVDSQTGEVELYLGLPWSHPSRPDAKMRNASREELEEATRKTSGIRPLKLGAAAELKARQKDQP